MIPHHAAIARMAAIFLSRVGAIGDPRENVTPDTLHDSFPRRDVRCRVSLATMEFGPGSVVMTGTYLHIVWGTNSFCYRHFSCDVSFYSPRWVPKNHLQGIVRMPVTHGTKGSQTFNV